MERTTFPPGEGPTLYRSDLCDLFGGCETCPGISTAERCDFEDLDPLTPIFCTQWRHRVGGQS
jgi:hypothetical protein